MAFSADCISLNMPLAVTTRVAMPMTVAQMPGLVTAGAADRGLHGGGGLLAHQALSWPTIAPSAASCPKTRPAMAMTMTSTGAIENTV